MGCRWRSQVVVLALVGLLAGGCTWITRASVDTTGGDAFGGGGVPLLSGDGRYVAFGSNGRDLVPGDANDAFDVFVRDLQTNTTTRVSIDRHGRDADSDSFARSISADGRYVAFESWASDLVAHDRNDRRDVFVRDLRASTTTRVSVDTEGRDPDLHSAEPSISDDGRYVAFESIASDLVAGDGNGAPDVFVRDLQANTTAWVSVDTTGGDADGSSILPSISDDGRYVAFESGASDLMTGDGNGLPDIFVRDLHVGTTARVSVDTTGGDPNDDSHGFGPSISGDGRYVAFESWASDLVVGDGNGTRDVFVRDRQANTTTRVSLDATGGDPDAQSLQESISDDGRYVAFGSEAGDLVAGDGNNLPDVFVRDLHAGTTARVSADFVGKEANGSNGQPSISGDGRYVAFQSHASNLVAGDGNLDADVFVRAVVTPTVDSVTPNSLARGTTATLTVTGSGFLPGAQATAEAFTQNGGVTVNSIEVVSETELQVSVSVAADASTGTRHLAVWNPGTGPGALATGFGGCENCLTIT
jgi:Tol biopolymer transport system component